MLQKSSFEDGNQTSCVKVNLSFVARSHVNFHLISQTLHQTHSKEV